MKTNSYFNMLSLKLKLTVIMPQCASTPVITAAAAGYERPVNKLGTEQRSSTQSPESVPQLYECCYSP